MAGTAKSGPRDDSAISTLHSALEPPPAPPFNKEQTPPGDLLDPSPRFHGGCFGV